MQALHGHVVTSPREKEEGLETPSGYMGGKNRKAHFDKNTTFCHGRLIEGKKKKGPSG